MFPESKVTEIYCMADDFCKEFTLQQKKYMIEDKGHKHRNKPNRMSDAEDYGNSHPVSLRWFPMFQALLQRVCLQTFETPVSPIGCLITVLWNWRRKYLLPHDHFHQKSSAGQLVPASVLSIPLPYVSAVTKES